MKGKIIGWNFKRHFDRSYNADGSTSLDTLTAEKKRLEARLVEIPKKISEINYSITATQNDITWLNGLSRSKRKDWEKANGKSVEDAVYYASQKVNEMTAQVSALGAEKGRIPAQITEVQKQLDALVKGEATGLELGLDKDTAQQLGEIQLEKERDKLAHERALREAELQKAEDANTESAGNGKKVIIIVSIVIVLAIIGYFIYKKKFALQPVKPQVV